MAQLAESCGFDIVWVNDHLVVPEHLDSTYPFSTDGRFFDPPHADWYEWATVLAYLAAATSHIRLGVSVAVLPLRPPLLLAKQLATIDRLSEGRVTLGVGVGWMKEEFAALDVPFAFRGRATDHSLDLLRACWSGRVVAGSYGPWSVGVTCQVKPTPIQHPVPVLIGGDGARCIRRVVEKGDGWLGSVAGGRPDPEWVRDRAHTLRRSWTTYGRDLDLLEVSLRVSAPAREAEGRLYHSWLGQLVAAGATSLSFDVGWRDAERTRATLTAIRRATEEVTV